MVRNRVRKKNDDTKKILPLENRIESIFQEINNSTNIVNEIILKDEQSNSTFKFIIFIVNRNYYLPFTDTVNLIKYFLEKDGFLISKNLYEEIESRIVCSEMGDIYEDFENSELKVVLLNLLNQKFYSEIIKLQKKVRNEYLDISNINTPLINTNTGSQKDISLQDKNIQPIKKEKSDILVKKYSISRGRPKSFKYFKDNKIMSDISLNNIEEHKQTTNHNTSFNDSSLMNLEPTDLILEDTDTVNTLHPFSNDWDNEYVESVVEKVVKNAHKSINSNTIDFCDDFYLIHPDRIETDSNYKNEKIKFQNINQNTGQSSRPFICHYKDCNSAFKRFEHLKRHYRIHTGERPFKCKFPGCYKTFARSDNLNQHLKVHNSGSSSNDKIGSMRFINERY
ncbi:hypothetical protein CWI37_0010p0080 [Hamiltosporidium tvaerminnensis]|uniref:C2H2-type domain-containing protein n=1 Tax=Hamiltosporidium tvaerminnensis TaxID=1176355 RepID=A0A4Q9LC82_9MICR|nr:negative regulation of erythrocyte differentiation [Hamiltosporidium tvaerminnensis]TBU05473.1 hypothetical protein CWI37_0010p0080 [Hamiltosporidium tvaerminnensis]